MKSLENIKSGDHLILHSRCKDDRRIVTVARTTKTQIIVVSGGRFRKADGYCVGNQRGAWTRPYLAIPNDGELDEVKKAWIKRNFIAKIYDTCQQHVLKAMSFRQIQRLHALLTVIEQEECGGCGNADPGTTSECSYCGGQKCDSCDMGDDVECPLCEVLQ